MTARGQDASGGGDRRNRAGPWIRYGIGLVVAGLLVYAVVAASGGLEQAIDELGKASLGWLPLALVLEMASYVLIGLMLRMLRGAHRTIGWGTTIRVALVLWGLGGLLPASPAEGIAMAATELRRRGVSRGESITMFAVAGWFQVWALALTAAAAAAVVSIAGRTDGSDAGWLAISAVVLVAVTLAAIGLARRPAIGGYLWAATWWLPGHRGMTRADLQAAGIGAHGRLSRLLGGTARRLRLGVVAVGTWVTDAACLWTALHAVHVHIHFGTVLLAYVIGVAASWVPLLPGGIGAVEAAVPAVLHHFGVPLSVGLAGTLLWRGFSLFLPALGGVLAYLSLRYEHPTSGDGAPEPVAPV
jgi:uncharacterized membrane protein YbhN (UPF0104 family)